MSRRSGSQGGPVSLFAFQDIITAITGIMLLVVILLVLNVLESKITETPQEKDAQREAMKSKLKQLREKKEDLQKRVEQADARLSSETYTQNPEDFRRKIATAKSKQEKLEAAVSRYRGMVETKTAQRQKENETVSALEHAREKLQKEHRKLSRRYNKLKVNRKVEYEIEGTQSRTPILVQCEKDKIQAGKARGTGKPETFTGQNFVTQFMQWAKNHSASQVCFFVLIRPEAASYADAKIIEPLRGRDYQIGYEPLEASVSAFQGRGTK